MCTTPTLFEDVRRNPRRLSASQSHAKRCAFPMAIYHVFHANLRRIYITSTRGNPKRILLKSAAYRVCFTPACRMPIRPRCVLRRLGLEVCRVKSQDDRPHHTTPRQFHAKVAHITWRCVPRSLAYLYDVDPRRSHDARVKKIHDDRPHHNPTAIPRQSCACYMPMCVSHHLRCIYDPSTHGDPMPIVSKSRGTSLCAPYRFAS